MTKIYENNFGGFLQSYRRLNNITRSDFAKKLGVSENTVFNWETKYCRPSIKSLNRLADETGLSLRDLYIMAKR